MIPKPPIFLMAFANDKDYRLQLEEEGRRLREKLADLHDGRRLEYQPLSAATHDELYHSFNRFHNRIHVFHFSGHSNSTFLELADKKARAANLATIMGMQKNLKLVFLNGCDNEEQRKVLFAHGVKAVIGTKGGIPDGLAILFSEAFYDALKGGKTILESYLAAEAKEKDLMDGDAENRAAGRPGGSNRFTWKLYAQNDADLGWKIPDPYLPPENLDYTTEVELTSQDANKTFLELTFQGMARLSKKYQAIWEDYKDPNVQETNMLDLQEAIYKSFPSLLAVQIRDLFTENAKRKGRLRLQKINEIYLSLGKLLTSIALASLWKAVVDENTFQPRKGFRLRPEYKADLKKFISLPKEEADAFDYIWLFSTIDRIFSDNDAAPFVDELGELHKELSGNTKLYSAYQFLEFELKRRLLAGNIASVEVPGLCEEAEKNLGILLRQCAFLITYQLVSVNDISVKKSHRLREADFVHDKVIMRGVDETIMDLAPMHRKNFTCNHAVVVTKDFQTEPAPLTLTPFLVDENAYKIKKREQPKIHFWAGRATEEKWYYQHTEDLSKGFELLPDDRSIYRMEDLEALKKLWDYFIQDLNLME
jgi:hypothetical protein